MTQKKASLGRRIVNAGLVGLVLPIVLPLALISVMLWLAHRILVYLLIWALWLPKGKDILFVSSDSPIWHEYMTIQVLPRVQERAIVLNWSERNKWSSLSFRVHVFRCFGGSREFNPLIVWFRPFQRARIYRFWSAFKDWKRGYQDPIQRMTQELFTSLQHPSS